MSTAPHPCFDEQASGHRPGHSRFQKRLDRLSREIHEKAREIEILRGALERRKKVIELQKTVIAAYKAKESRNG